MSNDDSQNEIEELRRRIERLEQVAGVANTKSIAGPDPVLFQQTLSRALNGPLFWIIGVTCVGFGLSTLLPQILADRIAPHLLGLPLYNFGLGPKLMGFPVGWIVAGDFGIGVLSLCGMSIGVVACGGGAVGLIACGGGAVGVIAFGGGAVGIFAFGGAACGYIAIGGGAIGRYVLASDGLGAYVLDRKRRDPEAIRFFCRLLPRLRAAFDS